jgi:hypothetical protein
MEHRDLLTMPDLTAGSPSAAEQGSLLSLSTGEVGRIFLQSQPCVASDAAPARPVKCGWFKIGLCLEIDFVSS